MHVHVCSIVLIYCTCVLLHCVFIRRVKLKTQDNPETRTIVKYIPILPLTCHVPLEPRPPKRDVPLPCPSRRSQRSNRSLAPPLPFTGRTPTTTLTLLASGDQGRKGRQPPWMKRWAWQWGLCPDCSKGQRSCLLITWGGAREVHAFNCTVSETVAIHVHLFHLHTCTLIHA